MKPASMSWLWLSLLVLVLDQISKTWIGMQFDLYEILPVMPGFNLTHVHNPGAAFSFLSDAGGWQRWFFTAVSSIISIILVIWLARLPRGKPWLAAALAMILGGAIGNLIDRLIHGHVIDFIDVYYGRYHWPAFNVADSAIFIGVVLLIIDSFWFDHARVTTHTEKPPRR